jgi:hypothetical protein
MRVWFGLDSPGSRQGSPMGSREHSNEFSRFVRQESCWVAERLPDSQRGTCSLQLAHIRGSLITEQFRGLPLWVQVMHRTAHASPWQTDTRPWLTVRTCPYFIRFLLERDYIPPPQNQCSSRANLTTIFVLYWYQTGRYRNDGVKYWKDAVVA